MMTLAFVVAVLQDGSSPLNPMRDVFAHLDKGVAAVIKGADPAEAFKPWTAAARKLDALKESLKGAVGASTLAVDFDLVFPGKDAPAFVVRVTVVADGPELRLAKFASHEEKKLIMPAHALDAVPADAKGFAETARAILKIVQAKETDRLPFLAAERIAALYPDEKSRKEATRELERSRKKAAEVCATASALQDAQIRIIDQTCVVRNDGGAMGTLEGGFAVKDGKLMYTMRELKAVGE